MIMSEQKNNEGISKQEQRFLREWEIQNKGPKNSFIILNAIIFSVMIYLFGIAITYFASEFRIKRFDYYLGILAVILLGILIAFVLYYKNQSRYLSIKLKQKGN